MLRRHLLQVAQSIFVGTTAMLTDADRSIKPLREMENTQPMSRRALIVGGATLATAGIFLAAHHPLDVARAATLRGGRMPATVKIVEFGTDGKKTGVADVPTIQKPDEDWQRQLSPLSYEVTRHSDTEPAFTSTMVEEHRQGIFRCICCDTALFSSATKFDSGTGWPSFWQTIARENVAETNDSSFGMERTAVSCRRCDAHLGHVFDDGPRPTGQRYCMNAASLRFSAAA